MTVSQRMTQLDKNTIAENLRFIINRDFESVSEFASKTGLDRSGIQGWLRAEAAPSSYALLMIHRAGVDLNELFWGVR